jgi:hypothetical protein
MSPLSKSSLVVNVKQKVLIAITVIGVIVSGTMWVRQNLAGMASQAVSLGISRVLGLSDVRIGHVTARGIRSIDLAGVCIGDEVSIDHLLVDYDVSDLFFGRAGLIESITGVHARGVSVDIAAPLVHEPANRGHVERKSGARSDGGTKTELSRFSAPIEICDVLIEFPSEDQGFRKLEVAKVTVESTLLDGCGVWKVALSNATYTDGTAFDIEGAKAFVDIRGETVELSDIDAQLLGGSVRGRLVLCPSVDGPLFLTGSLDIADLCCGESTISGYVRMDEDGAVAARGSVKLPQAGIDGFLEAEYEGCLRAPGVEIGTRNEARSDARPAAEAGSAYEAHGVLHLVDLSVGEHRASDIDLDLDASYGGGKIKAAIGGERMSMERVGKALGRAIPVEGWVDWKADIEFEDSTLAAVVTIRDGDLRSELWPQEFTDLSGSIEVAEAIPNNGAGSQEEVRVRTIRAAMGGGTVELSGGGQMWTIHGLNLEIEHPLLCGLVDIDATIHTGERMKVGGILSLCNADVDVVTAGFSKAAVIPDADLDIKIVVGDGVKAVREESWAEIMPSVVQIQGSVRQPRAVGYVQVGPGEVYICDIPLEILSGRVEFARTRNSDIDFSVVARDSSAEFPILATIYGRPGDVHLSFEPASGVEENFPSGELLMKLLDARLRLYILSRLGQLVGALPQASRD